MFRQCSLCIRAPGKNSSWYFICLLDRFDPNRAGEPVCDVTEALLVAGVAWDHRKSLADRGLAYALLSHDSAIEYMFLQPKAAQYNTALNVIIDKWPLPKQPKVPSAVREALALAVETAVATMVSAEARRESRGAHDRSDYPNRDDVNWLKHTLWFKDGNRLDYKAVTVKPLTVAAFEPKARVY